MRMLKTLEQRKEGLLISLDVKGAFDRVWWGRLKARLKAKGMSGRALRLLKNYLWCRFIGVVVNGDKSSLLGIFSGVPQGAKWSPKLWDFDISELPDCLSDWALLISYADDCALYYEFDSTSYEDMHMILTVNADLNSLLVWGEDNRTEFESSRQRRW